MLRVPGTDGDLLAAESRRAPTFACVYSPLDALNIAAANPERKVVFFAIGFETTAPAERDGRCTRRRQRGLSNFSVLVSHVLVPPAMVAILQDPEQRVQAFLGPGHVCSVMGSSEYEPIAARFSVPIVVTGFEPFDLLEGVCLAVQQLEAGPQRRRQPVRARRAGSRQRRPRRRCSSRSSRCATASGAASASLPKSGLRLRDEYRAHDAEPCSTSARSPPRSPPSASAARSCAG